VLACQTLKNIKRTLVTIATSQGAQSAYQSDGCRLEMLRPAAARYILAAASATTRHAQFDDKCSVHFFCFMPWSLVLHYTGSCRTQVQSTARLRAPRS
jgi:hypothetical protein